MAKMISGSNGGGGSIGYQFTPSVEVDTDTIYGGVFCDGIKTKTSGTVEVVLSRMTTPVFIDILAGAYNQYSIKTVKTGGTIPLADLQIYWQV